MLQWFAVAVCLFFASAYIVCAAWRTWRARRGSCGGGCGCGTKTKPAETPKLIDQLSVL